MKNRGFIKEVILIVGALVALKYFFDFDLIGLITEGRYKEVWEWIVANIWQKFLVETVWLRVFEFFKNLFD